MPSFFLSSLSFVREDEAAAWDLYVELLASGSRPSLLLTMKGMRKTALASLYSIFKETREIIKKNGPGCIQFTKIAIVVFLNQVIRPFTAKWHRLSLAGAFDDPAKCREFRQELVELQGELQVYTGMLARIADVEDLTDLEADLLNRPYTGLE
jgi:hypothetical protein